MREEKLITLVTFFHNEVPYLETWAVSVAAQTYLDKVKIIAIDDASTDGSLDLLKKLAAKYNLQIEYFTHEKTLGIMRSSVEVYHMIDTKYFTILDADDYWLTEKKLEKAINFLEAHEDFSAYAGNYAHEYKNGKIVMAIPRNVPSQAFPSMKGAPFFQTSAIVFRNFFTPTLLEIIDEGVEKYPCGVSGNDTFRNLLAFKFGKCYFENSFDSVYRCDIGIVGTLAEFERSLINMTENWQLFEFYKDAFGIDDNAIQELNCFIQTFIAATDLFSSLIKNMGILDVKLAGKYFNEFFERDTSNPLGDAYLAFEILLDHCKKFKIFAQEFPVSMGVR